MRITSMTLGLAIAAVAIVPAQGIGFGTFFAFMNSNGAVITSSGVKSSARNTTGQFEITFNRNINGCALLATVYGATAGYAVTRRKAGTTDALQVSTFNKSGVLTNLPFTAFILCNN